MRGSLASPPATAQRAAPCPRRSMAQVEEFYVITWEAKKEQIFELPTGGAAIMRKGPNLLKFARKEQCLALTTQLRTKFKLEPAFYRCGERRAFEGRSTDGMRGGEFRSSGAPRRSDRAAAERDGSSMGTGPSQPDRAATARAPVKEGAGTSQTGDWKAAPSTTSSPLGERSSGGGGLWGHGSANGGAGVEIAAAGGAEATAARLSAHTPDRTGCSPMARSSTSIQLTVCTPRRSTPAAWARTRTSAALART